MTTLSKHVPFHLDELSEGGSRGFDPSAHSQTSAFAARHTVASHVYADNRPLHGKPKTYRRDEYPNAEANRIVCAAHSALFDVDPGLCVLGSWLFERLQSMTWHMAEDRLLFLTDRLKANRVAPSFH